MTTTHALPESGSEESVTTRGPTWAANQSLRLQSGALALAILVSIFTLWQLSTTRGWVSPLVLAPPAEVWSAGVSLIETGVLWPHLSATLKETVLGLVLAVAAAITIGSAFAFSQVVRNAVFPFILVSQTFPKVAIAPLIVAALGYGLMPKVVMAALLAFFPVLTNTIAGLTEVSDDELNLMRSLRASRWQELRYLRIPNALAFIFPALNSAAVLALIGAIVGEFVASREGIGYAIKQYTVTGEVASTYAMLFALAAFGLAIYALIALAEKYLRKA